MECKLLVTVGVSVPREQFVDALKKYFTESKHAQFNEWNYQTLLAGEKDMIKTYARMLANPRYRSPLHQRDFKQSLQQSKTNYKDLQALTGAPDYLSKIMERQCTGLPDLNTFRDYFHQVMKLESTSFGLEMSNNGGSVYIVTAANSDKFAQDQMMYSYKVPIGFFAKSDCSQVDALCDLLGLEKQKPQVIIDHVDGRQFEN